MYWVKFQFEFPSTVGMIEDADVAMDTDGDAKGPQKKYYIDTVNLKVARKGMEMKKFLDDCMSMLITFSRNFKAIAQY